MSEEKQPKKRKYNHKEDGTKHQTAEARNERTKVREDKITAKAMEFGFASKSAMLTAIIEGKAIVVKVEKT